MFEAEIVLKHAGQLLTIPPSASGGAPDDVGLIEDGAVAIAEGHVLWVGPTEQLGRHVKVTPKTEQYHLHGRVVTPGLVDPHTHLIFAGTRERECAADRWGGGGAPAGSTSGAGRARRGRASAGG